MPTEARAAAGSERHLHVELELDPPRVDALLQLGAHQVAIARRREMLGKLGAGALALGRELELGLGTGAECPAALERKKSGCDFDALESEARAVRRRNDDSGHGT